MNSQNTFSDRTKTFYKLPAHYTPVVFAFFMSAIMAFLMCLVITAANHSLTKTYMVNEYLTGVLHAYKLAMPVAFMCVLAVRPLVLKLVSVCVRK